MENLARQPNCDPEIIKYVTFLGKQYYDALAQAVIMEHLEFRISSIGKMSGHDHEALKGLYETYLTSHGQDQEALRRAISLVVSEVGSVGNEAIGKVDGWQGAVSLLANYQANRFTTQFSASSSLSLINATHTLAHNNGGLIEHMVDQSTEDTDSLTLIFLQAKHNEAAVYHRSSKYAQDLYCQEPDVRVPPRDSKEAELAILHAGILDLFERGKEPDNFLNDPKVLLHDIAAELAKNYGEAARMLMDQLEKELPSIINEMITRHKIGYPLSSFKSHFEKILVLKKYLQTREITPQQKADLDEAARQGLISFWDPVTSQVLY